jgi:hypothetical protein
VRQVVHSDAALLQASDDLRTVVACLIEFSLVLTRYP